MTPEEITVALKEAAEAFPTLGSRQPEDEDIVSIREALVPLLLRIPFDSAASAGAQKHNLSGLIQRAAVYASHRSDGATFPTYPALAIYPTLADDAKHATIRKAEAIHRVKLQDEARRLAAETGASEFIRSVIDETWFKDLQDPDDFYTKVAAMDFLDHFEKNSTELAETEAVKIPLQMMQLYNESEGIPQYIKALEKAQRRSVRGKLPVSDNVLAATAINALLSTGDYKVETTTWLGKNESLRTWSAFKDHFSAAYIAEEQRKKYAGGADQPGQPFGGAATQQPSARSTDTPGGVVINNAFPAQMANTMDGFLDNIAAVVTTDSNTMQQMVAVVATLTDTNKQHTNTIASQQRTIAALTTLTTKQSATAGETAGATGKTWEPHPGYETGDSAYCWAHGFKLRKGHTGCNCKAREFAGNEDKRAATRSNTMGGSQKNKGFDA